jgi:hypothetical protein
MSLQMPIAEKIEELATETNMHGEQPLWEGYKHVLPAQFEAKRLIELLMKCESPALSESCLFS